MDSQFLEDMEHFHKNKNQGLQYLQLDDGSYVTVWIETQDQSNLGIGYQRFDSEW